MVVVRTGYRNALINGYRNALIYDFGAWYSDYTASADLKEGGFVHFVADAAI